MARCREGGSLLVPGREIYFLTDLSVEKGNKVLSTRVLQELISCSKEKLRISGISAHFPIDEPGESNCSGVGSRIIPEVCKIMPPGFDAVFAGQEVRILVKSGQKDL